MFITRFFEAIFFLFLAFIPCLSFSQNDNTGMVPNKPFNKQPPSAFDIYGKLYLGGNVGFQAGVVNTTANISPMIAYRLADDFMLGIGTSYLYLRQRIVSPTYTTIFSTHVFGASVFARYFVLENIYAHAEYELLNLATYDSFNKRKTIGNFLAGGGYMQKIGDHFATNFSILWAFNQSDYSPYNRQIIIRPGFFYVF
jgi:hypothetical protein